MQNNRLTYIKNILLPCFLFSSVTGVLTGMLIFLFKWCTHAVTSCSDQIYAFVREDPRFLPLLLGGAALVGLAAAMLLHFAPNCRGGGIPTSVALLRGHIDFKWFKSILLLFPSAMLTFLGGVPLGTEGPCVQMGTALGRGTVRIFAGKNRAWERYIMTGGACAGFAAATYAPLTGIFFAFEEAHRRFSPMIFMTAAMSAVASTAAFTSLCRRAGMSPRLFEFSIEASLPLQYFWVSLAIGILCGVCAVAFTKLFHALHKIEVRLLSRIPFAVKVMVIFVATAAMGFAFAGLVGSGHRMIDELIEGHGVWYLLILCFCVRAVWTILANQTGVTGGLFVPSLAFGAMMGALCGKAMIAMGILPASYYTVAVLLGMVSFLAASSRTPMTAVIFAVEALGGLSNMLPVAMGVTFAYLVIETFGVESFNEAVVDSKIAAEHRGKTPVAVDVTVTVDPRAFMVGKEIRDILWPPTCTVVSVRKGPASGHAPGIAAGDELTLHYLTYDPPATAELLAAILGPGARDAGVGSHSDGEGQHVPDI